jgi:DNA-binding response OmpR family regulator
MDGVALVGKMTDTALLLAVPILMLSALHKEDVRSRLPCLKAFLQKPLRVRQLMAKVRDLLQPLDVHRSFCLRRIRQLLHSQRLAGLPPSAVAEFIPKKGSKCRRSPLKCG